MAAAAGRQGGWGGESQRPEPWELPTSAEPARGLRGRRGPGAGRPPAPSTPQPSAAPYQSFKVQAQSNQHRRMPWGRPRLPAPGGMGCSGSRGSGRRDRPRPPVGARTPQPRGVPDRGCEMLELPLRAKALLGRPHGRGKKSRHAFAGLGWAPTSPDPFGPRERPRDVRPSTPPPPGPPGPRPSRPAEAAGTARDAGTAGTCPAGRVGAGAGAGARPPGRVGGAGGRRLPSVAPGPSPGGPSRPGERRPAASENPGIHRPAPVAPGGRRHRGAPMSDAALRLHYFLSCF